MDEIRTYFSTNYKIEGKKIYDSNNSLIENKYIEINNTTYTLLQILFYYKNKELPFHIYKEKAIQNGIPIINSEMLYILSTIVPPETYVKKSVSLVYDFKFILNHLIKKKYTIIVPFSPQSPINIFNCQSVLTTGRVSLSGITKRELIDPERTLFKPMKTCTAEIVFQYKRSNEKSPNNVIALFLDNSDWQHTQFLNQYGQTFDCPVFSISQSAGNDANVQYVRVNGDRIEMGALSEMWRIIETYIQRI